MANVAELHTNNLKQRIGVMLTIKASLEFTGRSLPEEDARKLNAYQSELAKRMAI